MKKLLFWAIIILVVAVLFPKPYDTVGGIAGYKPGPLRCLGYNFWPGGNGHPDAIYTGYCIGVPYKSSIVGKNQKENLSNETVNWKTYRSEEYGFEVRYPTGYDFKELNKNYVWFGVTPIYSEGPVIFSIEVKQEPVRAIIDSIKNQKNKNNQYANSNFKESIIEVNKNKFTMLTWEQIDVFGEQNKEEAVFIEFGSISYEIRHNITPAFPIEFNQVLSTFKFIK